MYTDEAKNFLEYIAGKGFALNDVADILSAHNALSGQARDAIAEIIRQHKSPTATLQDALQHYPGPVSISLLDNSGTKHDMMSFPRHDPPYTPQEEWLLSLPLQHINNSLFMGTTAVLQTKFNADELTFLGFPGPSSEECSPEVQDLMLRADMANAGFSERLLFLQQGTPFETRFDPNCMDVVNSSERLFFCEFLQDYTDIFIRSDPHKAGVFYAYGIIPDTTPIDFDLLGIKLHTTLPGKGLLSTVDGKCAWAEHRAKKARAEVLNEKDVRDAAPCAGKEYTL